MSLIGLGRCGFEDMFEPIKGKNEWGVDTLFRKLSGYRALLPAFIATLSQGQGYQGYFLQTWEPDEGPYVSTITLTYKGLATGGTPIPDIKTNFASTVGRSNKTFLDRNSGLGLHVRDTVLWKYGVVNPGQPTVVADEIVATRPVYVTAASAEFTYKAIETHYKYVSVGKPAGPRYFNVDTFNFPVVEAARVSTNDGLTYGREGLDLFELAPVIKNRVAAWNTSQIIGTPFFECEDIVRRDLVDPADL